MNRLRPRQARSALSRWTFWLLLLVFAFRLLLPNGLMPSASASARGFGLALCSGHGEFVVQAVSPLDLPAGLMPDETSPFEVTRPDGAAGTHQNTSAGVTCPFSAVFAYAIGTVVLLLFVSHFASRPAAPAVRCRRPVFTRFVCARQRARAPPLV